MGKIKLAVAGETVYAGRLSECIRKNAPEYLEVLYCKAIKELPVFLAQTHPDILLCEQCITVEENLSKTIVQIQLVDNSNLEEEEKNRTAMNRHNHDRRYAHRLQNQIFRYQKGPEILRQVFQIYEQHSQKNLVCRSKTADIKMTAFYAPGGHDLLLPFSISYAVLSGKKAKVLYLNLSEFSGMKTLFRDKGEMNLSDLIFGIRQKKEHFLLRLQSVLHHAEQFDYVLPPENPKDLYELREEDLVYLLTLLQEQTDYKKIIWLCGTLNEAVEQVLEYCCKVVCITKETAFGKYRKAAFESFMQKEPQLGLQKKIQYVVPQIGNGVFVQGMDILTQLQSGAFAKQVQELMEEET